MRRALQKPHEGMHDTAPMGVFEVIKGGMGNPVRKSSVGIWSVLLRVIFVLIFLIHGDP
jgi:hypothetical protein